jgi:hypothetical protein
LAGVNLCGFKAPVCWIVTHFVCAFY